MGNLIATILPHGVESAEEFGDALVATLFAEEEAVVAGAVARRQREFAAVRSCARVCLDKLGYPRAPILPGDGGAPTWPSGVVGSMTHCAGYCSAAVAPSAQFAALGIDAEPDMPLPPGVLRLVATSSEVKHLEELPVGDAWPCWDLALFSAKEAVYKAWFPLTHRWLDFRDVEVTFDARQLTFTARLPHSDALIDGRALTTLHGRWTRTRGLLLTTVAVTRSPEPSLPRNGPRA